MADMLASDKEISIADAVKEIYKSETYRKLEDDTTKLWHLGPVALYQELMDKKDTNRKICEIPVVYAKLYMDVPCYLIYHMEEQLGEPAACHLSNTPVKIRPELMPSRRAEK